MNVYYIGICHVEKMSFLKYDTFIRNNIFELKIDLYPVNVNTLAGALSKTASRPRNKNEIEFERNHSF